jgi:hypothetical protein
LKRHFSKDKQVASQHTKRFSTPLIITNTNQNHNEMPLHTHKAIIKTKQQHSKGW